MKSHFWKDHATQQNISPKEWVVEWIAWKIDLEQPLGGKGNDEKQKLLFIHISKSISLNMRFRAAPENPEWTLAIHLSAENASI